MDTWREHSFKAGQQYIVLKKFKTLLSLFDEGEIVVYKYATYSRYDCSTIFVFEDASGEVCSWFLHDHEADNSSELFRLEGPKGES